MTTICSFIDEYTLVVFSYLTTLENIYISTNTSFNNYMFSFIQKKKLVVSGLCDKPKLYFSRGRKSSSVSDFSCWRFASCFSDSLPHFMFWEAASFLPALSFDFVLTCHRSSTGVRIVIRRHYDKHYTWISIIPFSCIKFWVSVLTIGLMIQ